jgi:hypothetical protein
MTAIVSGDILFLLAAPGASAGFATGGTSGDSWGKYCSTTQVSGTPLNNLFPDITGAQNAADQVDYACVFILNNTAGGDSMLNTVAWLPTGSDVAGGATLSLAVDPAASSLKSSSVQQAAVIGSATAAPSGVSGWVNDSASSAGGVSLGTIAPNFVKAVWIRRTATNSAPLNNDGFGLEIDFDTQA